MRSWSVWILVNEETKGHSAQAEKSKPLFRRICTKIMGVAELLGPGRDYNCREFMGCTRLRRRGGFRGLVDESDVA